MRTAATTGGAISSGELRSLRVGSATTISAGASTRAGARCGSPQQYRHAALLRDVHRRHPQRPRGRWLDHALHYAGSGCNRSPRIRQRGAVAGPRDAGERRRHDSRWQGAALALRVARRQLGARSRSRHRRRTNRTGTSCIAAASASPTRCDHIASERAFAGSVPVIGVRSGPTHGHGVCAGHHAGLPCRYSDGGSSWPVNRWIPHRHAVHRVVVAVPEERGRGDVGGRVSSKIAGTLVSYESNVVLTRRCRARFRRRSCRHRRPGTARRDVAGLRHVRAGDRGRGELARCVVAEVRQVAAVCRA